MNMRPLTRRHVTVALLAAVLGWAACSMVARRPESIALPPESEVELTAIEKGTTYKVHGGNAYRVEPRTGRASISA
jgi:hypothetical protein